jgi:predicted permease
MGFFGEWLRRLGYLLNRRHHERDLQREMEIHREMMGDPKRFGNTLRLREESRDAWGWNWLEFAWHDLKFAGRSLWRSPGFALGATIVLSLGIGLNLFLFHIYNMIVLKPLPVRDVQTIFEFDRLSLRGGNALTYAATQFIRSNNNVLSAVLTLVRQRYIQWGDSAERSTASLVSANWFDELGCGAVQGRVFHEGIDDGPDSPPVVVVSYRFWAAHLNSAPNLAGTIVRINDRPVTIAGVAPESFTGLSGIDDTQMWMPIEQSDYFFPGSTFKTAWDGGFEVRLYGRLKRGVSKAAARDGLRLVMNELAAQHPDAFKKGEWLEPFWGGNHFLKPWDRAQRLTTTIGFGFLSLLVLTIACANLGNLVLSRAIGRMRELGVRISLGASRWRVMRHLLAESALISMAGAAAGLAIAYAALNQMAASLDILFDTTPDWRTMLALLAIAFFAMLAVGFLPTWAVSRRDLNNAIRDGGENASSGMGQKRLRLILSGVQVAGSCILLLLATATARNLRRDLTVDIDVEKVVVLAPQILPGRTFDARSYWNTMRPAIASLAETEDTTLATASPFGRPSRVVSGLPDAPGLVMMVNDVEPQFFRVMRIPIIAGRPFDRSDDAGSSVIISRRVAMEAYGGLNALGQPFPRTPWITERPSKTIVGIAEDVHVPQIDLPNTAEYYLPFKAEDLSHALMLVRAKTNPNLLPGAMREASRRTDDRVVVEARLVLTDFRNGLRASYVMGGLAGGLAVLTLLLACLGLFGVISYGATRRRKEISIRMALGADRSSIVTMLMKESAWPAVLGIVCGFTLSFIASELLKAQGVHLGSFDAPLVVFVASILAVTCGLAALSPALQAVRTDITQMLRND